MTKTLNLMLIRIEYTYMYLLIPYLEIQGKRAFPRILCIAELEKSARKIDVETWITMVSVCACVYSCAYICICIRSVISQALGAE